MTLEYHNKLLDLQKRGESLLVRGEIEPFVFDERFKRRFSILAFPDHSSIVTLQRRLIRPLERIAGEYGIEYRLAERDLPLHFTIKEGEIPVEKAENLDETLNKIHKNLPIETLNSRLIGLEVSCPFLIIGSAGDTSNLVLASKEIPDEVMVSRNVIESFYSEHGTEPLMANLFHSTLARISNIIPGYFTRQERNTYKEKIGELKMKTYLNPVTIKIDRLYIGPTRDFIDPKHPI